MQTNYKVFGRTQFGFCKALRLFNTECLAVCQVVKKVDTEVCRLDWGHEKLSCKCI